MESHAKNNWMHATFQHPDSLSNAKSVVKFIWTHPSNQGQRARALFRAARFQARGRLLRRRTLAKLGQRSSIWAELHRTAASKTVYANPPDHPEMLVWQEILGPGDLFIDVGANIGSYTVWAGELGAEVIALEPAADTFVLLAENVNRNGYPTEALRVAAGATCGMARMTYGQDSANRLDPIGSAEVRMVTIDSIIKDRRVAGMKVDVEGFEMEVLRGCEQALLDQRIRVIQLEWNSTSIDATGIDRQSIASLLAKYGYRIYRPQRDGVLVPVDDLGFGADVFAMPDNR